MSGERKRVPRVEAGFEEMDALVRRAGDVERFRVEPLPRSMLDRIVEAATALMPTRFNLPPWRVMVVVGDERERLLSRIAEALTRHWGGSALGPRGLPSEAVLRAPALLVVFSTVPASENIEALGLVAAAAQSMVLLAHASGLGTHRIFSSHAVAEAVLDYAAEFLGPEIRGGDLVAMLAVGWPEGEALHATDAGIQATWVGDGELPLAPPATVVGDIAPPAAVLRSPSHERVLVVDSYPYNRALLETQLHRAGYSVEVFSDGESLAKQVAEAGQPDLFIISDTLPDISGFELVRRVLGQSSVHAPVIVTTARRDSAFRIGGLSAGVDYYLRRPVNSVELLTAGRILLDRNRLLRELERATAFQQALLEAMEQVGVAALDEKLNIVYASPGITRLTGYTSEDLIGRPPKLHAGAPPDLPPIVWGVSRTDLVVRRKDGATFDAELMRSAMRDPSGRITGYIGVLIDIDDRKRMERELRGANAELERLLGELRTAQARLVQHAKMAALGQIVAGVAHEINTPLAAVVSNNDLFLRCFDRLRAAVDTAGVTDGIVARDLEAIEALTQVTRAACTRITDIVRTLRTFARLDEAEVKAVDLHEGLESTLVLVAHLLKCGIRVLRRYGRLPLVECHPNQINQIFMNLIVNACQAMGECGTLTLTTAARGDEVEIAIADTGRGIPPEQLARIFDPGFTTKGAMLGTGLGLSIVYQIVEGHGGEVAVVSERGGGATFTVRLPVRHRRADG